MKLREFLENIDDMIAKNPDILEMEVISASDSEGNSFEPVNFSPSLGIYEDNEFTSEDSEPDEDDNDMDDGSSDDTEDEYQALNAICIN